MSWLAQISGMGILPLRSGHDTGWIVCATLQQSSRHWLRRPFSLRLLRRSSGGSVGFQPALAGILPEREKRMRRSSGKMPDAAAKMAALPPEVRRSSKAFPLSLICVNLRPNLFLCSL